MILVDVNLLIYATNRGSAQHLQARDWLDRTLNGSESVGLPWAALLGFLRLATARRVYTTPLTMALAWEQVLDWLSIDRVSIPQPTSRHAEVLGELLKVAGVNANLVPDAHLAALAIEHGLTLCSTDGDFARFPGLRWENPLAD